MFAQTAGQKAVKKLREELEELVVPAILKNKGKISAMERHIGTMNDDIHGIDIVLAFLDEERAKQELLIESIMDKYIHNPETGVTALEEEEEGTKGGRKRKRKTKKRKRGKSPKRKKKRTIKRRKKSTQRRL